MSAWDQIYADWTATMSTPVALSHLAAFALFVLGGVGVGYMLGKFRSRRDR